MSSIRSRLVLCVLAILSVSLSGCSLFRPQPQPGPEPTAIAGDLNRAEELIAEGDLEAAALELHALVEDRPESDEAPEALFHLAILYLAPGSPMHDGSQGIRLLRDVTESYPASSWALAADSILRLAARNVDLRELAAHLEEQLEKLKQIDIGPDG